MIVWHGVEGVPHDWEGSVVTIGVFDGVHRGHQVLIREALAASKRYGVPSVLVTFDPHPMAVFAPEYAPALLSTLSQRLEAAASMGIDYALVIDFNRELAGLSPEDYFRTLLVGSLKARAVVVGENFTFGRDAAGTAATIRDLGREHQVATHIVDLLHDEGQRICSSLIREHLNRGDVRGAAWALGRPFEVSGPIVRGAGRGGKELGFPTANQYFGELQALPAQGVYAGWLRITTPGPIAGDMEPFVAYPAAISVGTNPTFGDERCSVESFVLDREADLYGKMATVSFVEHLRGQEKFDSVPALLEAITADVTQARAILEPVFE